MWEMARYIPDISTQRWVIIAPGRILRPSDHKDTAQACPFCQGNEQLTPPEVYRVGDISKQTDWKVRVVPNKFPITDIHEVIIHSPDDTADLPELSQEQVQHLMQTYRQRFNTHREDGNVLIFCNYGERAGASLRHPHSQLVVVPQQIRLDILHRESINNVIVDNTHYTVYCPEFSQWPYEVWVTPKISGKPFGDATDEELNELGNILQQVIKKLKEKFSDLNYNYYIHHGRDWYLRVIPRLIHRAGFELGTGLSVNVKDPADAAAELKE